MLLGNGFFRNLLQIPVERRFNLQSALVEHPVLRSARQQRRHLCTYTQYEMRRTNVLAGFLEDQCLQRSDRIFALLRGDELLIFHVLEHLVGAPTHVEGGGAGAHARAE